MSVRTLVELFDGLGGQPRPDLLRHRPAGAPPGSWRDISTGEFVQRTRALSRFLIDRGVEPGDRVLLLSENRPDWSIADFAILCAGAASVPVYATLLPEQACYILKNSGARVALVSTPEQYEKLRPCLEGTDLQMVVVFDPDKPAGAWVVSLEEATAAGGAADGADRSVLDERKARVTPESLATIIYTSGTTGEPKGVMLTHANFASQIETVLSLVPMSPKDAALSFLPLSHVLERMVEYCYYRVGLSLAFAQSIDTVRHDLVAVRPTVCAAVPRLFEKTRTRLLEVARAGPTWKQRLFHWALDIGRKRIGYTLGGQGVPPGLALQAMIADRLVFSKVRARLGGRIRFFISGGAPLARDLGEFFATLGITILEGYGLTETSPVVALNRLGHMKLGTVGKVIPGVEVRIADDGEILVRGECVMKGYWGRPEETAAALEGGWFHTGDIGFVDRDGFLLITDRKKDLLVTSAGKNVAPQPLENALKSSRYIVNAVCLGDRRNFISALIVPEMDALLAWAREKGILQGGGGEADISALLGRREVRELIGREIERTTERFAPYERVKKFALLPQDFSIESDEITPTHKIKRRVVAKNYAAIIESLYT